MHKRDLRGLRPEPRDASQGLQGYGVHLSSNHFGIIRDMYGFILCVFLFLRIEAPAPKQHILV